MADDSTIAWRLAQLEEAVRGLSQRVVAADLYARDRAELERDIAELRAQLAEEKLARKESDKDEADAREKAARELKAEIAGQGSNWRQFVYAGVVPGLILLAGILLQLKGGR